MPQTYSLIDEGPVIIRPAVAEARHHLLQEDWRITLFV